MSDQRAFAFIIHIPIGLRSSVVACERVTHPFFGQGGEGRLEAIRILEPSKMALRASYPGGHDEIADIAESDRQLIAQGSAVICYVNQRPEYEDVMKDSRNICLSVPVYSGTGPLIAS
jgi:hypothetical protein